LFQVMQRRRPSLNKTTWDSLSSTGKKTWDEMSDEDKAKVTAYVEAKLPPAQVNLTEREDETPNVQEPTTVTTDDAHAPSTLQVNQVVANAIANARKKTHPADLRRTLSPKPKRSAHNVEFSINTVDFQPPWMSITDEEVYNSAEYKAASLASFRAQNKADNPELFAIPPPGTPTFIDTDGEEYYGYPPAEPTPHTDYMLFCRDEDADYQDYFPDGPRHDPNYPDFFPQEDKEDDDTPPPPDLPDPYLDVPLLGGDTFCKTDLNEEYINTALEDYWGDDTSSDFQKGER
jgi:hypothetical protein